VMWWMTHDMQVIIIPLPLSGRVSKILGLLLVGAGRVVFLFFNFISTICFFLPI
jgi:hypothetical protein